MRVSAKMKSLGISMRRRLKAAAWSLLLCLCASLGPSGEARAGQTAYLDLAVSFFGNLSVSIDGAANSARTLAAGPNALVVAGSATVTNDSTGLMERWELSVATVAGGGNWSVLGSTLAPPDVDEYAFQTLFVSSAATPANEPRGWSNGCPAANAADWDNYASTVTGAAAFYNTFMYADPVAAGGASGNPDVTKGNSNGNMIPAFSGRDGRGVRGLCTRIYMPAGSEMVTQPQVIRLTVTAAPSG